MVLEQGYGLLLQTTGVVGETGELVFGWPQGSLCTWLGGKRGWYSAPVFNVTNSSSFQDAPATSWERGRTCPVTTRRGGASACPMWRGMTATSVQTGTGTWGAATAASPAAATRTAPAAPTATRYCPAHPEHPQGRLGIFQQYFIIPASFHPCKLLLFVLPMLQALL